MPVSRSAQEFLRRSGLAPTDRVPSSRTDNSALRIFDFPRKHRLAQKAQLLVADSQGVPVGDRGPLDVWPPPQEVSIGSKPQ